MYIVFAVGLRIILGQFDLILPEFATVLTAFDFYMVFLLLFVFVICLHQPGEDTSHEFLEDIIRRIFISFAELHQQWRRHQIEHRGSAEFADS